LPSGMGFATAFFAVSMLGKTVVPLNYALSPRELLDIVKDAGITTLISFEADAADRAGQAIFGQTIAFLNDEVLSLNVVLINHHHVQGRIRVEQPFVDLPNIQPDDTAVLLYTSGSTGKPKGVIQTHKNLVSNADAANSALGAANEIIFSPLPTFHSFALVAGMLYPLLHGHTAFLEPKFMPRSILERLGKHGVTVHLGVPSMYKAYLAVSRMRPSEAFATVKVAVSGGAPLPLEIANAFERVFGKPLVEGFGCTETSPIVALNPTNAPPHLGTVGQCVEGVTIEIRAMDGTVLPAGEAGEMWVHGPNVTLGYYNKPEETAKVFQNGWYNTQDMATVDDAGFIRILGRTKHMIIVGGENVYPAEVEHAVLKVPQVRDVAVTGQPDESRGEVVLAFVVPEENWEGDGEAMEGLIRDYINSHQLLADYKIPRKVKILEAIPLLPTGKPDLPALRGERTAIMNVAVQQAQAAAMQAEMQAASSS
ncbi:MAG: AMP-binding protein, partial [bacterium]